MAAKRMPEQTDSKVTYAHPCDPDRTVAALSKVGGPSIGWLQPKFGLTALGHRRIASCDALPNKEQNQ
jgi:hypothetical protein